MNTTRRSDADQHTRLLKMIYASLCLSIALVLPFVTGQIPRIGQMLCPMHIPAFLCGFLCGWPWGMAVGFIAPLMRSVLFGMPAMFPEGVAMAFELAAYGAVTGVVYRLLRQRIWAIFVALPVAMVAGRIVWGAARLILAGLSNSLFSWEMFLSGAVLRAIPGMILHLFLVPGLVLAMDLTGLIPDRRRYKRSRTI